MNRFLLVGLGGALGSAARYAITLIMHKQGWTSWPMGTIAVNVLGSFLIGLLSRFGWGTEGLAHSFLIVGVLGGFTTYSSFNQETLFYFDHGQPGRGIFYLSLMASSCLAAGFLGLSLGRRLLG